jgi:hypothetical protein
VASSYLKKSDHLNLWDEGVLQDDPQVGVLVIAIICSQPWAVCSAKETCSMYCLKKAKTNAHTQNSPNPFISAFLSLVTGGDMTL